MKKKKTYKTHSNIRSKTQSGSDVLRTKRNVKIVLACGNVNHNATYDNRDGDDEAELITAPSASLNKNLGRVHENTWRRIQSVDMTIRSSPSQNQFTLDMAQRTQTELGQEPKQVRFDFAGDSHQRDARHSHSSVLTEEPQRLHVKFVLNCSTCVLDLNNEKRSTSVSNNTARSSMPIHGTSRSTTRAELSLHTTTAGSLSRMSLFRLAPTVKRVTHTSRFPVLPPSTNTKT